MLTPKFNTLVQQLRVLPGVGAKTAQRMALHLLTHQRGAGIALAQALETAMHDIKQCQRCRGLSDDDICPICNDPRRDETTLCVVETAADVAAIEQSGGYHGLYFVLGGHLSPLDGINADDIGIPLLMQRLKTENFSEVILATSTTVEGQTTAHFISECAKPFVGKISRIAQGMPLGGELEYLDSMTLHQALQNRANALG